MSVLQRVSIATNHIGGRSMRTVFSRTNCLSLIVFIGILLPFALLFVGIASADTVIFQNENTLAVRNSPQQAAIFRTSQPFMINTLRTYHWNNGRGTSSPGTIGLTASDGKKYGPWNATGSPGQGGVPNANWITKPNVIIPPANTPSSTRTLPRGLIPGEQVSHT